MATGRARMYFVSKKKEERDRAMVDMTFGLHLDCMGGTPRVRSVAKQKLVTVRAGVFIRVF